MFLLIDNNIISLTSFLVPTILSIAHFFQGEKLRRAGERTQHIQVSTGAANVAIAPVRAGTKFISRLSEITGKIPGISVPPKIAVIPSQIQSVTRSQ